MQEIDINQLAQVAGGGIIVKGDSDLSGHTIFLPKFPEGL